jgi:trehalose-6-phosphate synthase
LHFYAFGYSIKAIAKILIFSIKMNENAAPAGSTQSRLLIVSNRLPVKVSRGQDGNWGYSLSSGGLVSAISGLKKDKR